MHCFLVHGGPQKDNKTLPPPPPSLFKEPFSIFWSVFRNIDYMLHDPPLWLVGLTHFN